MSAFLDQDLPIPRVVMRALIRAHQIAQSTNNVLMENLFSLNALMVYIGIPRLTLAIGQPMQNVPQEEQFRMSLM